MIGSVSTATIGAEITKKLRTPIIHRNSVTRPELTVYATIRLRTESVLLMPERLFNSNETNVPEMHMSITAATQLNAMPAPTEEP